MKATTLLHNLGQSLWLDNITRDLLNSGTLKRYIDELAVTGLTSNPTIFDTQSRKAAPMMLRFARSLARINSERSCSSSWRWRTSGGPWTCSGLSLTGLTESMDMSRWKYRRYSPTTPPALWQRPRACMLGQGGQTC